MPAETAIPELLTKSLIRRHFLPIGERTLCRWVSAGQFPRPDMRISGKALFWKRSTVQAWIDAGGAVGVEGER